MKRLTVDSEASPAPLRDLVKWSVALLGTIIKEEAGDSTFTTIENLRQEMAALRDHKLQGTLEVLRQTHDNLEKLPPESRALVAQAFTLMLELINSCENAYRSHRLSEQLHARKFSNTEGRCPIESVVYVLTAHPTEARSPANIWIFRSIQSILQQRLSPQIRSSVDLEEDLRHALKLAWRIPIVRSTAPRVIDEAEHIFSILFEERTLNVLLSLSRNLVPIYLRTWVGGDKDGHPGVDETTMIESLSLSRRHLLRYIESCLGDISNAVALLPEPAAKKVSRAIDKYRSVLLRTKKPASGDGRRIGALKKALERLTQIYEAEVGALHPRIEHLKCLFHVFPGVVIPLELRESSDVLMSSPNTKNVLAIDRMLSKLAHISAGGHPNWYARGLIISMTESIDHLRVATQKITTAFKKPLLPVIPLFEEIASLRDSHTIVLQMFNDPLIASALSQYWQSRLEIMVGYSDSSKEGGVFPSRLAIAHALDKIDQVCVKNSVKPVFFHGSGGSVDRGGGTIEDQTAWWPRSALQVYKVTIQGEMVERTFSSNEIIDGQIRHIVDAACRTITKVMPAPHSPVLDLFAQRVSLKYQSLIESPDFLRLVETATPYLHLSELKIGSRPAKRSAQLTVKGLRAIPWVLCWTQTRLLLPTWWGVGSAWKSLTNDERENLKTAYGSEAVFGSFIRSLGFTLAKVELGVFFMYLESSGLSPTQIKLQQEILEEEYANTVECLTALTGSDNPLWFRPWLGASIRLRSPMIHPLNLLQLLAIKDRDYNLFRLTVTGVSSGMLTTG